MSGQAAGELHRLRFDVAKSVRIRLGRICRRCCDLCQGQGDKAAIFGIWRGSHTRAGDVAIGTFKRAPLGAPGLRTYARLWRMLHRCAALVVAMPLWVACSAPQPQVPQTTAAPHPAAATKQVSPSEPAVWQRSAEDSARDQDRKPFEVLDFFGISAGHRVAELMTGKGYYAEVLAQRVGPEGAVYGHNSPFVLQRFAEKPWAERLQNPRLSKVTRLDSELDDPKLPKDLDAVMMVLFYHDTYWQEVDRAKMNAAVFAALKPGGVFGIIDHHAQAGSEARDVKTLHRVDAELVKRELLAAGFEFAGESALLRHEQDKRTVNVFTPQIRGKTDRFVYKFRVPTK